MSPSPLRLMSQPKGSHAKRIHPFLDIADQENSILESADRFNLQHPSAQRLTASMDVILSAYSNIHPQLADSNSKWVNDGLEDTVKLLDMCNAVSDSIAGVKHYQTLLQSAVHCLDHAGILEMGKMSCQTMLVRATNMLAAVINVNGKCSISTTSSLSKGMVSIEEVIASSTYSRIGRSDGDLSEEMCILKDCTASLLKTVVKALTIELPRTSLHGQRDTRRCSSLRSLFERVKNHNRSSKGFRFLLHELVTADVLVRKLHDLLVEKQQKTRKEPAEVKELVDALKKCTAELDEGIAALDRKIKELFNALIRIRVALLDILSYSL